MSTGALDPELDLQTRSSIFSGLNPQDLNVKEPFANSYNQFFAEVELALKKTYAARLHLTGYAHRYCAANGNLSIYFMA
jgi:hypothetical protein